MKTKLTLSLPEKTVREAKQIARLRRTTVSGLFAESVELWRTSTSPETPAGDAPHPELAALIGAFQPQAPFDERSARIRAKHG